MRKPASRETISASIELCKTEVCFLRVQLLGTNVGLPKIHKTLLMLIMSLQGLLQNQSLDIMPILHCCAVFPT